MITSKWVSLMMSPFARAWATRELIRFQGWTLRPVQILLALFRCERARETCLGDGGQVFNVQLVHVHNVIASGRSEARTVGAEGDVIHRARIAIERHRLGDRLARPGQVPD